MQVNEYKPLIVAFCCNWCSYAGADLAGNNRLNYPADVKIIRVPCSCRVNPMFILRAFQRGADGVILCGCHPGDCHYTSGNYYTRRRMALLFSMLDYLGIEKRAYTCRMGQRRRGRKVRRNNERFCRKGRIPRRKQEIGGFAMQELKREILVEKAKELLSARHGRPCPRMEERRV